MKMRGVEWGTVFNASGARGFFGEGYWFHRAFGVSYKGSTFVAKTTTLEPRLGNMPLTDKNTPQDLVPKCIVVKPLKGVVLNSVGLSGPGAQVLANAWLNDKAHKLPRRVVHSFMSVAQDAKARLEELRRYVEIMKTVVDTNGTDYTALQINFSCPNAGLDPQTLSHEVGDALELAHDLDVPLMAKVNALFPPEALEPIQRWSNLDAIVVSNTIPWGKLPNYIDWKGLFGSDESPLAHLGGGGLSGKPLLPIVRDWIWQARKVGIKTPIVAGGGILCPNDAEDLMYAGADAIELGSVSILRPWNVRRIIRRFDWRR